MANPTLSPTNELKSALWGLKKYFFTAGFFSFFINLLMLVPSLYMLQVYDRVLASRSENTLIALTLLMLFLYALMSSLEWVRSRLLVQSGLKLDNLLNNRIFTATFKNSLRHSGANASQTLQDFTNIRQFLTGQGLFAFFDAPWAPIFLIIIFLLHPLLGLVALVGAILLVILTWLTEKLTGGPLKEANKASMQANQYANNTLRNAEVIEAMGMHENLKERWNEKNKKSLANQGVASDRAGTISAVTKFIRITQQSLILGAGALLVIDGKISPGTMIAASILMGRALAPVELAIGTWKSLISVRSSYERVSKLLEEYPADIESLSLPAPKGNVVIEHIMGGAPGVPAPFIKGVSLNLTAGSIVGIIGPSGCGKSTLARIIIGVWTPLAGKVRLDGADIHAWDKHELGPYLGYLPQDIELFEGTVAENIARFGTIDSEKIIEAANRAGVHEMILRFPAGYNTMIGAGGSNLSGGQRQRIALARAMYGNPKLVILDEPNSNLDEAGEHALAQAMITLKEQGTTVIVVTHRMSILKVVDQLVVMKDGMVQGAGPRDQVLQALKNASQTQAITS